MQQKSRTPVRFLTLLLLALTVIGWSVPALAQDVTGAANQVVDGSGTPVGLPSEPTESPTDPEPTDSPAVTVVPTAPAPTSEPVVRAAAEGSFEITFYLCGSADDAKIGTTDFAYSGDVVAADTTDDCDYPSGGNWDNLSAVLTDVSGVLAPITITYADGFEADVEEGTYTVTLTDGAGYTATMVGSITILPDSANTLTVFHYVEAADHEDPTAEGYGYIGGSFVICKDAARAGQTDFFFYDTTADSAASNCVDAGTGEAAVVLDGTPLSGEGFDPITSVVDEDGRFEFPDIPFGTYTLTDVATGDISDSFTVGGSEGADRELQVFSYHSVDDAGALPVVVAETIFCQDNSRADSTEFFISYGEDDFVKGDSATCFTDLNVIDDNFPLILNTDPVSDFSIEQYVWGYDWWDQEPTHFAPVTAGSYTLSQDYSGYYGDIFATSDSFSVVNGDRVHITVINYVSEEPFEPPTGGTEIDLIGQLFYCAPAGDDRDVNFIIDNGDGNGDVQASETSTCQPAAVDQGEVVLYSYGNGSSIPDEPVGGPYYPYRAEDGSYFFNDFLSAGYYQLAFRDSSIDDQEYRSSIFPLNGYIQGGQLPANTTKVLVYLQAPPTPTPTTVPTETPLPTETPMPTETPAPTETPMPTETAIPTETPEPTQTPVIPDELVSGDVTLNVAPGGTLTGDLNELVTGGVPPYTFVAGILPTQGTLVVNLDGTFTYIANSDATGTDSFTYTVTDSAPDAEVSSAAADTGTVTILISAQEVTPTATVESSPSPTIGITPTAGATVGPTSPATPQSGPGVTKLPSTGQGADGGSSSFAMLMVLMTAVSLIGALALTSRKRMRR